MKAMVLERVGAMADLSGQSIPLALKNMPIPVPGPREILVRLSACGVCRTELDQIEGRITPPRLPVVVGHQPVGRVVEVGSAVTRFRTGDRTGATWIFSSCGDCRFCERGNENLCEWFMGTGCHADGGYAEYFNISEDYAVKIPDSLSKSNQVAPLMCAGTIGYRSLNLSGMEDGMTLGLYGFGSAHHLVLQMAKYRFPNSKKFVLSRNRVERDLAMDLGADWVGEIDSETPVRLNRVIDTTPIWKSTLKALENLEPGGRLVINAIRKEEVDKQQMLLLDYPRHLWLEKELKTVANVTRKDAEDF